MTGGWIKHNWIFFIREIDKEAILGGIKCPFVSWLTSSALFLSPPLAIQNPVHLFFTLRKLMTAYYLVYFSHKENRYQLCSHKCHLIPLSATKCSAYAKNYRFRYIPVSSNRCLVIIFKKIIRIFNNKSRKSCLWHNKMSQNKCKITWWVSVNMKLDAFT